MVNRLVDLATIIVAHAAKETQDTLLANLMLNLSVLVDTRPHLVDRLAALTLAQVESVAVVEEAGLGFVLYEKRQDQWVVLTSQASAMQRAQALLKESTQHIVYFLGIGFGEELVAWYVHTQSNPPKHFLPNFLPAIYLFEPIDIYFLLFLLTGNRRALLSDPRFYPFVGATAFADYYQLAISTPTNYSNKHLLYSFAADRETLAQRLTETAQAVDQAITQANVQAVYELTRYYDADFGKKVAKKIKEKRYSEIKILGLTSRYTSFLQYCARDLLSGFADLGCQVDLDIESSNHYYSAGQDTLMMVNQVRPDFIFALDSLRLEVIPRHIPYHTWIQDELEKLVTPNKPPLTDYDFVDVLGTGWQQRFQQRAYYQHHSVGVLPLGFHQGQYFPEPCDQDIDVLYVSHLLDPEITLQPYRLGAFPVFYSQQEQNWFKQGGSVALLASAMRVIAASLDVLSLNELSTIFSVEQAKETWLSSLNIPDLTDALWQLLREPAGQRGRIGNDILSQLKYRPMQALIQADVSVALYGKHWEQYPSVAPFARGVADNGDGLNQLQNRSKICINNSAQISFHMRAVEIMASGAFMLSRRIPLEEDIMPITQLFEEGADVVMFDDEQDLVQLVNHYLPQSELRHSIAHAALNKLKAHHAYRYRAQHILDDIVQRFMPYAV